MRAFPVGVQKWYHRQPLGVSDRAQLEEWLNTMVASVFDQHDDCTYHCFASHPYDYAGRCKAQRTFSRSQFIAGLAFRYWEHQCESLGLGSDPAFRYRVWPRYPPESLCVLPSHWSDEELIARHELLTIRGVRPRTQLGDLKSGFVPRVVVPRPPPRFRPSIPLDREVELNIHVRNDPEQDLGVEGEDVWRRHEWFASFSTPFHHLRRRFFEYTIFPTVILYDLALRLATTQVRVVFHLWACLPQRDLFLLALWLVAQQLVAGHQRRRASQRVEYMISHWTPAVTRRCDFRWIRSPRDPGLREIRVAMRRIFDSVVHPSHADWFVFHMRKTRFLPQNPETYAQRYSNASSSAKRAKLSNYLQLQHLFAADADVKSRWEGVRLFRSNWSFPFPSPMAERRDELSAKLMRWSCHFGLYADPSLIHAESVRVYARHQQERNPADMVFQEYVKEFEEYEGMLLDQELVLSEVDHDLKRRACMPRALYDAHLFNILFQQGAKMEILWNWDVHMVLAERDRLLVQHLSPRLRRDLEFDEQHMGSLFFLLKAKCFDEHGHRCTKVPHNCTRNITSTVSNLPAVKRLKRRVAAASRAVRRTEAHVSHQLWNISRLPQHLMLKHAALFRPPPGKEHECYLCGEWKPVLVAVQIDATGFFESASSARGLRRQRALFRRVGEAKNTSHVTVHANGKYATLGERQLGQHAANMFSYSFDEVLGIFHLAAADGYFQVGDLLVRRAHGWPQGGEESEEACAIDCHHVERLLHMSEAARRRAHLYHAKLSYEQICAGARVVDNILFWSECACEPCLVRGHTDGRSYPLDVGMALEDRGPQQKYLHSDLFVEGNTLVLEPHSHNREFARCRIAHQHVARLLPPLLAPFQNPGLLHQFVSQSFARFQQICVKDSFRAAEAAHDLVQECIGIGFSLRQVLAAVQQQKPNRYTPLFLTLRSGLKNAVRIDDARRKRERVSGRSAPRLALSLPPDAD